MFVKSSLFNFTPWLIKPKITQSFTINIFVYSLGMFITILNLQCMISTTMSVPLRWTDSTTGVWHTEGIQTSTGRTGKLQRYNKELLRQGKKNYFLRTREGFKALSTNVSKKEGIERPKMPFIHQMTAKLEGLQNLGGGCGMSFFRLTSESVLRILSPFFTGSESADPVLKKGYGS